MKKVLVIRFSSIGDIILTSPVLRCIRQQKPGWQIHVLTKESFAPLFRFNPSVDKIFTISERGLKDIIKPLRAEKYDHIIDLHRSIRSLFVRLRLCKPSSSFPKLNIRKYLLVKLGINFLPARHIVDRYFEAVRRLGVINDHKGLDFFFDPQTPTAASLLPAGFGNDYIALVNGGRHQTKVIPVEKAIQICNLLGKSVVLLGGSEDAARGDEIIAGCSANVYNACGKYTLMESARILEAAQGVVSGDTGLMHIAAALRKPLVSVWGNTVPAFGMYPYIPDQPGLSHIAQVDALSCRPCSKLGYEACPEKHFRCMMDQDAAGIVASLTKCITKQHPG